MQVRNTKARVPRTPSTWGMSATGPKRSEKVSGRSVARKRPNPTKAYLKNGHGFCQP